MGANCFSSVLLRLNLLLDELLLPGGTQPSTSAPAFRDHAAKGVTTPSILHLYASHEQPPGSLSPGFLSTKWGCVSGLTAVQGESNAYHCCLVTQRERQAEKRADVVNHVTINAGIPCTYIVPSPELPTSPQGKSRSCPPFSFSDCPSPFESLHSKNLTSGHGLSCVDFGSARARMRKPPLRSPESHTWSPPRKTLVGMEQWENPVWGPHCSTQPAWASQALQSPWQATDTDQKDPASF